jgi:hypothetical protein
MRVVLDANVLVSALISGKGNPAQIFSLWSLDEFELAISPPILEEIHRVIHYPRIQKKYSLPEETVDNFLQLIAHTAVTVDPSNTLDVVEKDPSDNRYIECALASGIKYIVTRDAHLLDLKEYQGIFIITPASFLTVLNLEE